MAQKDIGLDEIKLDFDAFPIQVNCIPAMSLLLKSLFKTLPVNITDLAQLLANQTYIGSVLRVAEEKVSGTDGDDEAESEYEEETQRDEFLMALTSVLNLTMKRKRSDSVSQISALVESNCKIEDRMDITEILAPNSAGHVGLILNERINGLPSEIGKKMLSSLISEMKICTDKGLHFKFEYYLIPVKCYRIKGEQELQYFNEDDGEIASYADYGVDVELGETVGEVHIPKEGGESDRGVPFVRFILVKTDKLNGAIHE